MNNVRLHSASWLALCALCVAESYLLAPSFAAALGSIVIGAYCFSSDSPAAATKRLIILLVPLGIAAVLVQTAGSAGLGEHVWFNTEFFALGPKRLAMLAMTVTRMGTVIGMGLFIADRASPAGIRQFVTDLRLPVSVARVLLSARGFVNLARANAATVLEAESLRGLAIRGTIPERVRALPAVIIPLMANLFVEAANRSAALERRGFALYDGRLPNHYRLRAYDYVVMAGCVMLLLFQLAK